MSFGVPIGPDMYPAHADRQLDTHSDIDPRKPIVALPLDISVFLSRSKGVTRGEDLQQIFTLPRVIVGFALEVVPVVADLESGA